MEKWPVVAHTLPPGTFDSAIGMGYPQGSVGGVGSEVVLADALDLVRFCRMLKENLVRQGLAARS